MTYSCLRFSTTLILANCEKKSVSSCIYAVHVSGIVACIVWGNEPRRGDKEAFQRAIFDAHAPLVQITYHTITQLVSIVLH